MVDNARQIGSGALEGRTVLITGAGSGMGKATAQRLGLAGATVIVTDVKGQDEVADLVRGAGGRADSHPLDVTDAASWARVVDAVIARTGRIDGLANVAGVISETDTLLNQTEQGWARILAVDLKGPWLGMRAVIPRMLDAGGGRVVNVASVCGLIGMPNVIAYSAAKGGVIAMSRQVAIEYAAAGIRVNAIAPGVVDTPMLGDATAESTAGAAAATPVRRIGAPDDIARMIVYLLGDGGDFITGQVLTIDGGWTAQ